MLLRYPTQTEPLLIHHGMQVTSAVMSSCICPRPPQHQDEEIALDWFYQYLQRDVSSGK